MVFLVKKKFVKILENLIREIAERTEYDYKTNYLEEVKNFCVYKMSQNQRYKKEIYIFQDIFLFEIYSFRNFSY